MKILPRQMYFEIFYGLAGLAFVVLLMNFRYLKNWKQDFPRIFPERSNVSLNILILIVVACLAILFFSWTGISNIMGLGLSYPIVSFDALNNFAMKSVLWFDTGKIYPNLLLDPEFLTFKRRYPPIVPVTEGVWAMWNGAWSGLAIKKFFLFNWLACGGMIYVLIRRVGSMLSALLGACVWFVVPVNLNYIWGAGVSGYGDVTLSLAFLCSVLAVHTFAKDRSWGAVVLLSLIMASVFWVKKEGLPYWGALFLALLWLRSDIKKLAVVIVTAFVFYVMYKLTIIGLPSFHEKDIRFDLPFPELIKRIKLFIPILYEQMTMEKYWGEDLWVMFIAIWIYKFIYVRFKNLFSIELFLFSFMAGIYAVIQILSVHHYGWSFDLIVERLTLHIYPLFIIATMIGFEPLWKLKEAKSDDEAQPEPDREDSRNRNTLDSADPQASTS
jgi:hypothetical protein